MDQYFLRIERLSKNTTIASRVRFMLRDVVDRDVTIELRGGELQIAWADKNSSVWMTGPAATVFTGAWPLETKP